MADKPKDDPATIKGVVVASDDPEQTAASLAERLPGWAEMKEARRAELVSQSITQHSRPTRAMVGVSKDDAGTTNIQPPQDEPGAFALTIFETFATTSSAAVQMRLTEIFRHFDARGGATEESVNAALAFIGGCAPENEHQAAMATQMALIHDTALHALRSAGRVDTQEAYESYINAANKLSRTFGNLTDSYAKLQRGGVQTVKHVNVYEGGQAVVADTVHTGGMSAKRTNPVHATRDSGGGSPVLGNGANDGQAVPVPGCEGEGALSYARRGEG